MAFASPRDLFGYSDPFGANDNDNGVEDEMEASWADWALNPRHRPITHEFTANLKSGVTVALVNVPMSIAVSMASGGTPSQGIVTAFWCGLAASICGSSHFNIVGPTGSLSAMLAVLTMRHGSAVLPVVAIMSSIWLFLFFLLRVDRYMRYVCTAVAHGFSVGVAIILATSQLPSALGLNNLPPVSGVIDKLEEIALNSDDIRANDTLFFIANVIPLFYCVNRWGKDVPWAIVFAGVGIFLGYISKPGSLVLLNTKFPNLRLNFHSPVAFSMPMRHEYFAPEVVFYSLGVAIVGLLEALVAAQIGNQTTTNDENLNYSSRREAFGLTVANFVGGFFGGIPSTAALARTSLNVNSGAWSRVSAMIGCCTVALLASIFLPWFEYIPMSTVAALLMLVAYKLVNVAELKELNISDTPGTYAFLVTATACILTDTFFGLIVGGLVSCFFNMMHVGVVRLDVHPADDEQSFVAVMHSSMVFVNTNEVKDAFADVMKIHKHGRYISIVLDECQHIDFDGAKAFSEVIKNFRKRHWTVRVTGARHIRTQLETSCPAYVELVAADRSRGMDML